MLRVLREIHKNRVTHGFVVEIGCIQTTNRTLQQQTSPEESDMGEVSPNADSTMASSLGFMV
jgi:hypothetical protein